MKNFHVMALTLALFLWVSAVEAFDSEAIRFSNASDLQNAINISFKGKVFKPALDVLDNKGVKTASEYQRFSDFFRRVYERNRAGDAVSVLTIWHPKDRDTIKSAMDDAALKQNKAQFEAMVSLKLNMVIQYGSYYICLVETTVQGQAPVVMKFPVTQYKGELLLTNGLNGDYFYEMISHYLDQTNFRELLIQQRQ